MQDSIKLSESQMLSYMGGGISAALINAFNSVIKTFYGVGQNLGSTLRRLISHNYC
jgi:hypothetical protein